MPARYGWSIYIVFFFSAKPLYSATVGQDFPHERHAICSPLLLPIDVERFKR